MNSGTVKETKKGKSPQHSVGPAQKPNRHAWPMLTGAVEHARTRGGAPGAVSSKMPRRQDRQREHHQGRWYPPSNPTGVGAHRRTPVTKARLGGGITVVFVDGGGDGGQRCLGVVLQQYEEGGGDAQGEAVENQSRAVLTE
jgi:hypothetical protein